MGNQLLTPPELEPETKRTADVKADPLQEADGSMWASLLSNLRDAFSSSKQPPLELSSQPVAVADTFAEEPVWKTLWTNVQDAFFPKKLPPLELTSQPVAVADPMAVKRSPVSSSISFVVHAVIIGLILLFALETWRTRPIVKKEVATDVDLKPYIPPTLHMNQSMGGGGGGGNHEIVEASKGKLPKMSKTQIAPPQLLRIDHPKLAVEPTVVMPQAIKLPDTNMPNIGIPQSPQVALASQGGGSGSGFGSGRGGGIGSGNGNGVGPGTGGGYGGGVMRLGGGVSNPQVIYAPDPEFSDEARRAKYQGICLVGLIVDAHGNPQNVRVIRPLGMGLDEKAEEAVRQYKFKPAMYQGHAVAVEIQVEVNFHIY
ncbi:energy transducer TonB [Acidipila sp. 4G-K13]|uniref:Energy transducer TonB n=1 Tax=Paracidobacterium acidisoli TaxID=2303751 RepID=A0A372IK64_9BACT|nr:energy transducer TonB [Paracidobacterium acidisoli]MBT9332726.1 energy transducer TonB [Paracidobacterium acidisoli]